MLRFLEMRPSAVFVLMVLLATAAIEAAGQDQAVVGAMFGAWHMSCSLNASTPTKSCSVWAGPVAAESPLRGSTQFTLLIDPETPYATIASGSALFVKMRVDENKPILVDCTRIGICELSQGQARELVQEASRGENLSIQMALPDGTYAKSLFLSEYRAALADFLEEERLYELKMDPIQGRDVESR